MTKEPNPPVIYEKRYCLFLDILGFKNIIAESAQEKPESTKSFSKKFDVAGVHSALSAIQRAIKPPEIIIHKPSISSKQVTQFSDSIVVSYKLEERSAVFGMLYDIQLLQIDLVKYGILVRGAITAGLLFHNEHIVFGPALVEAAELEKLAMYPRVILHQEIIDHGKRRYAKHHSSKDEERYIRSLLKQDLDGMYYIDYFNPSPGNFDADWDGLYEYLISLREIVKRLSQLTKNPSIKLKHSWMRQKYNDVARTLDQSKNRNLGSFLVPEDLADHIHNLAPFK